MADDQAESEGILIDLSDDPPPLPPPVEETPSVRNPKDSEIPEAMRTAMETFLGEESQMAPFDFMQKFCSIRMQQESFRLDPNFACEAACSPLHFQRNRYRDILPYDKNRVLISQDEENPDGYMNASKIELPNGKTSFIAAQAPLPQTLDEWWKMIDEHKVNTIVMLCKLIELNKIKCERYWPAEKNTPELYGDYEITLEDEKTFTDDEYVLRSLKMTNQSSGESRLINQLHYSEWPDHGCPSGEKQLLNMIEEMAVIHEQSAEESPILVHCSAGVGRTGTIIAVNYIRELMVQGLLTEIQLTELVLFLRQQRASMVQTQDQFQFVHRCVAAYCRNRLGIPEPTQEKKLERPQLPKMAPVKLIAPPTPTDVVTEIIGQEDPSTSTSTTVPGFPYEPPSPEGPEVLGRAAL